MYVSKGRLYRAFRRGRYYIVVDPLYIIYSTTTLDSRRYYDVEGEILHGS